MKKNYRIVLVGNETLAAEAGQRLIERGHQVLAIITESEAIAAWAKRQDVPRRTIDEIIEGEDFDILFSLAYLRPLPLALIERRDSKRSTSTMARSLAMRGFTPHHGRS